jgi:hypothetical protein
VRQGLEERLEVFVEQRVVTDAVFEVREFGLVGSSP